MWRHHHTPAPPRSTTNTFIWCGNFLWQIQRCQRLQDHKELVLSSPTTFCTELGVFLPGSNIWSTQQGQGSACQGTGAGRSSTSQQSDLFLQPANTLLCLKSHAKLLGTRVTLGSQCLPSSLQMNPTFSSSTWASGSHLSTRRIIRPLLLLLTVTKLTVFKNHNKAISKPPSVLELWKTVVFSPMMTSTLGRST